jgi:hypothetical protein
MNEEPKPLDPDVLAILAGAKALTPIPGEAQARIFTTLEARILGLSPGGGGGGAGPGSSGARWVGAHPWTAVSGAFVLGGAVALAALGRIPEKVVVVDRIVTSAAPPVAVPPPKDTSSSVSVPVESLPEAPPSARGAQAPAPSDYGQQLAAESALLDLARTAVGRGEPEKALAAVDRHAAEFPHGLLREEREALGIKALAMAGKTDEARARAARFRERYPASLFLSSIEASLGASDRTGTPAGAASR